MGIATLAILTRPLLRIAKPRAYGVIPVAEPAQENMWCTLQITLTWLSRAGTRCSRVRKWTLLWSRVALVSPGPKNWVCQDVQVAKGLELLVLK